MDQAVIENLLQDNAKLAVQNLVFCDNEIQVHDFFEKYLINDTLLKHDKATCN